MLGLNSNASILAVIGLSLASFPSPARAAGDRMAVLVVADQDPDLSDNLTEVAISKLAERREHRLVGWRELHDRLPDILEGRGIGDCIDRPCLARLGAAAGAESALLGDVRRQADQFVVRLILVNLSTAAIDAEFSETTGPEIAPLIALLRKGVGSLSVPRPTLQALQAAPAHALPEAGTSPTGTAMLSALPAPARRARWVTPVAYATGGLAAASLSAAIVTGSIAGAKPAGATRAETQDDLDRRDRYAGIANSLYLIGSALAVSAVVLLVSQLRRR